ncbi:16S rRNA (cytosine(1402)-N(4))-methyltransferase [Candidatus Microgenomates bacterium]|nr:MAG: 16S rRNA (cytosine(1402)-N(4))-methyltransferase [Candidatus Microgenomates bacterium]
MHKSVLLRESIEALHIKNQGQYIDATLGAGGHTIELLRKGGCVLGIDADESMLKIAVANVNKACPPHNFNIAGCFKFAHDNFINIDSAARLNNINKVDGIIADLGVSMYHYKNDTRGFTFDKPDQLLDMRLSPKTQGVTAADLLNSLPEKQLVLMFADAMPMSKAKRLARKTVVVRDKESFVRTSQLTNICETLFRKSKTHPATQAFSALRMAVNNELDNLDIFIDKSINLLVCGGRLVIITFHSTEDSRVNRIFKQYEKKGVVQEVRPSGLVAGRDELNNNPSARSAKLRVIEKI